MRSPAELIDTNTIPNAAEIVAIGDALVEPTRRLHILEEKITALETTLNQLLQAKDKLCKYISAHTALLSPFRHLPPDILREIFYHCLPLGRNPVMSNAEAPMVLVQVCSQWRDVALTTPKLWAALHVAIPDNPASYTYRIVCDHSIRIAAVTAWLSRSGILPISLSISVANSTRIQGMADEYVDTILPFTSRWRKISLALYDYDGWPKLLERIKVTDVPLLESIHLVGFAGYSDDGNCCIFSKSRSGIFMAPRLHMISVLQRCSCWLRMPVNWSQLTHFDLANEQHWSVQTLMMALSQCVGLQYVRIKLPWRSSMTMVEFPESALPQLFLPKLIFLSIIDSYKLLSSHLFRKLHAPHLHHLSYQRLCPRQASSSGVSVINFNEALVAFSNQLVEPLEELQLNTGRMTDSDIMGFLYLFSSIKRLSLICPKNRINLATYHPNFVFGDELLAKFTKGVSVDEVMEDQGSKTDTPAEHNETTTTTTIPMMASPKTPVCPQLEVFHCINALFTLSALLEFLQARSSPDQSSGLKPLRRVIVNFSQVEDHKHIYEAIRKLNDETEMVVNLSKQPQVGRPIQSITRLSYYGLPEVDTAGMGLFHAHQSYFGF